MKIIFDASCKREICNKMSVIQLRLVHASVLITQAHSILLIVNRFTHGKNTEVDWLVV